MGLIGYLLGRAWLATGSQASQAKFIACKRVRFGNLIQPGSRETVFGFLVAHRFEIEDACRARGGAPSEPGSGETRNFAASWEPGSGVPIVCHGSGPVLEPGNQSVQDCTPGYNRVMHPTNQTLYAVRT